MGRGASAPRRGRGERGAARTCFSWKFHISCVCFPAAVPSSVTESGRLASVHAIERSAPRSRPPYSSSSTVESSAPRPSHPDAGRRLYVLVTSYGLRRFMYAPSPAESTKSRGSSPDASTLRPKISSSADEGLTSDEPTDACGETGDVRWAAGAAAAAGGGREAPRGVPPRSGGRGRTWRLVMSTRQSSRSARYCVELPAAPSKSRVSFFVSPSMSVPCTTLLP
jgi:hypothetical protein